MRAAGAHTRERSRERDDALIDSVRLRHDAHGFEAERPGLFLWRWPHTAGGRFRLPLILDWVLAVPAEGQDWDWD